MFGVYGTLRTTSCPLWASKRKQTRSSIVGWVYGSGVSCRRATWLAFVFDPLRVDLFPSVPSGHVKISRDCAFKATSPLSVWSIRGDASSLLLLCRSALHSPCVALIRVPLC